MNILLLLFAFLPVIVVPAHARILSESAGGKLALIITIYGRKPPSPPPSPSSSPPTHPESTIGSTASPPPAPPRTKPIGQGTSYERTRSPPPPPKAGPSPGQLGSTSPWNRIISIATDYGWIKLPSFFQDK
ncbi:unnamed protein product [Prunus brigantina]